MNSTDKYGTLVGVVTGLPIIMALSYLRPQLMSGWMLLGLVIWIGGCRWLQRKTE